MTSLFVSQINFILKYVFTTLYMMKHFWNIGYLQTDIYHSHIVFGNSFPNMPDANCQSSYTLQESIPLYIAVSPTSLHTLQEPILLRVAETHHLHIAGTHSYILQETTPYTLQESTLHIAGTHPPHTHCRNQPLQIAGTHPYTLQEPIPYMLQYPIPPYIAGPHPSIHCRTPPLYTLQDPTPLYIAGPHLSIHCRTPSLYTLQDPIPLYIAHLLTRRSITLYICGCIPCCNTVIS